MPIYPHPQLVEPHVSEPAIEEGVPYKRDGAFWWMTATQFLGAFNDNVFKQMVLLLCTAYVAKIAATGDVWQSIAGISFALPFILFSGLGGYVADRYSKRAIVVGCKVAEIAVMLCGTAVLLFLPGDSRGGLIALCTVLFLMGAQSAFFGPAKYGILPEMLRERDLPAANGLIQMTTFLAIIFGTVLAGQDILRWKMTFICVVIAVVGTITSLLVRKTPVAQPEAKFSFDAMWINRDMRALLSADRALLTALLVSTLFWFIGGAVVPAVNGFGEFTLKVGPARTSVLAAMMGVGIAIGCPVAGAISRGAVRFSLVRLGAFGISVSLLVLGCLQYTGLGVASIESISRWALITLGFFGGLYAVTLETFLQAQPPAAQKGRMIGSKNLLNWTGIVLASVFHMIAARIFGKGTPVSFIILGLMILPVALFFRPQDRS